jgi:hypothetical protein
VFSDSKILSNVLAPLSKQNNFHEDKDGNYILKADDGTEFLLIHQKKDKSPWGIFYKLTLQVGEHKVGHCDFRIDNKHAIINNAIGGNWNYIPWYGIWVDPIFSRQFKGIGKSLMSIAVSIAVKEGADIFAGEKLVDEGWDAFFRKCGFYVLEGSASLQLTKDLAIPDVNIRFKNRGISKVFTKKNISGTSS